MDVWLVVACHHATNKDLGRYTTNYNEDTACKRDKRSQIKAYTNVTPVTSDREM